MGSNNSITSPTDVPSLIVKQPEAEDSNEGGYKTELEEDSNEVATTSDPGHDYGASTEDDANNTDKDEKDLLGFLLESKKNEKESKKDKQDTDMEKEYIIHDYDAGTEDDANKTDKEKKDKKTQKT